MSVLGRRVLGPHTHSLLYSHGGPAGGPYYPLRYSADNETGPSESTNLTESRRVSSRKGCNPRPAATMYPVLCGVNTVHQVQTETEEAILHDRSPSTVLNAPHVFTSLILTRQRGLREFTSRLRGLAAAKWQKQDSNLNSLAPKTKP